jgi:hypothetical protein
MQMRTSGEVQAHPGPGLWHRLSLGDQRDDRDSNHAADATRSRAESICVPWDR